MSGSFVTSLCVTWQGYVILGHCVPKLTLAVWLNPNHSMHFHAHAGTQKSNPDDFTKTGNSSHCHGMRQSTGGEGEESEEALGSEDCEGHWNMKMASRQEVEMVRTERGGTASKCRWQK